MFRSAISILFVGAVVAPVQAEVRSSVTFESQVRPLLKANCFECHGEGDKLKGGLDLRLGRLIQKGGKTGPALVVGKPEDSLLYRRVRAGEMPPDKSKLTKAQVDLLARWITDGAKVEKPEPEALAGGFYITAEDKAYWAFQPIRRYVPPTAADSGSKGLPTPVDAFLLAKLKEKGLSFAPEADKQTLIRRVTFDLIGLPPSPEEVDAFVQDRTPDAYEKLIDRLLASPRYGERWGRHWLDVAGYADSEGASPQDPPRVHAYKYRDYVIRSFNADKPFDRFIQEQLAGDEMIKPPYENLSSADQENLIATGFLRMAPDGTATSGEAKIARNQVIADTIRIVSSSLLGLSIGCAQCHNHRYDPIPQTDYYRLRAILEPAFNVQNWKVPAARRVSLYTDADRKKAKAIEAEAVKIDETQLARQKEFIEATFQKELAKLPEALREPVRLARNTPDAKRTPEQNKLLLNYPSVNVSSGSLYLYDPKAAEELKKLADQAAAVRAKKPAEDFIHALTEVPGEIPATQLHHRGDPDQPKQAIAPGGLAILDEHFPLRMAAKDPTLPTSGRRLAFARWLTDCHHPLTARVLVNRVWMHHFGRGLVASPGDFGKLGQAPTHPELLDWLASQFMLDGWSMKKLHKLIVISTAYRQSSRPDGRKAVVDPDNRLLARMSVRRLEAETIRDNMLAVSGRLVLKPFGPPVPVRENEVGQIVVGKGTKDLALGTVAEVKLPEDELNRRSIFVEVRRSMVLGMLETFDAATMEPNCEARIFSTVTPQSLLLMNSDFMLAQAEAFAARLQKEAGGDPKAQIIRGWRLAFGLSPSPQQIDQALAFLEEQKKNFAGNPKIKEHEAALASFCQALLSANAFLYVD